MYTKCYNASEKLWIGTKVLQFELYTKREISIVHHHFIGLNHPNDFSSLG
jgi:hypothetical protein